MAEIEFTLLLYGLLTGAVAGAIAGVLAGIAGVGGGLIYVPIFYLTMPAESDRLAIHILASMVAIVLTGFFSARAHLRLGHINNSLLFKLLPGLLAGAAFGLWSTLQVAPFLVLIGLSALNLWVAFDYGRNHRPQQNNHRLLPLLSAPIGYISGLFGIGGGTMLVPLLRRFIELRAAVGTSAMCGVLMALGAVVMNLLLEPGWQVELVSVWPFLIAVWLGVLAVLPFTSGWSAELHDSMDEEIMRLLLKTLFSLLAAALFLAAMAKL